jgi:hypothetical protein
MDHLPQELLDQICGYLPADTLQLASYVSNKLRKAAEQHAGKYRLCQHKLTKADDLEQFTALYSGFRLRYLQRVEYEISFPVPENGDRGCRESTEEQRTRD